MCIINQIKNEYMHMTNNDYLLTTCPILCSLNGDWEGHWEGQWMSREMGEHPALHHLALGWAHIDAWTGQVGMLLVLWHSEWVVQRSNGDSLPEKLAIPKSTGTPAQTATGGCLTSYSVHTTGPIPWQPIMRESICNLEGKAYNMRQCLG